MTVRVKKRIVGITDDVDTCSRCGKTNLKRTVAIEDEAGHINFYGTECVNRILGTNKKKSAIINEAIDKQHEINWKTESILNRQEFDNKSRALYYWRSMNPNSSLHRVKLIEKNGKYIAIPNEECFLKIAQNLGYTILE